MVVKGKAFKYGDDVNTDVIYPGRYTYQILDDAQVASHALEDLDIDFAKNVSKGDIVVGGKNWGCGSAREQAVKTLKFNGVAAIITKGFARIYFRNCLNEGLLAINCPEAVDAINTGDIVSVDVDNCKIIVNEKEFSFPAYPEYVRGLVNEGGIVPFTIKKIKERNK